MKRTLPHLTIAVCLLAGPAFGQVPVFEPAPLWTDSGPAVRLPGLGPMPPGGDAARRSGGPRLFRMPPRSLEDSAWLDAGVEDPLLAAGDDDDGRIHVLMGDDNPYFDFRRPGDPGGVGYQRFHTQVLLADNGPTCFHLTLQAVTPAGAENDGVQDGPSVVFPTVSYSRDLGDGSGLVGFVGKSARASLRSLDGFQNIHYGLALQQPLSTPAMSANQQIFLFVEALGRHRTAVEWGPTPPGNWELLPGLHWQSGERCWLSGGLLVPFGAPRPENGLWQITCSWQF